MRGMFLGSVTGFLASIVLALFLVSMLHLHGIVAFMTGVCCGFICTNLGAAIGSIVDDHQY